MSTAWDGMEFLIDCLWLFGFVLSASFRIWEWKVICDDGFSLIVLISLDFEGNGKSYFNDIK